jgi:hypothetical protein
MSTTTLDSLHDDDEPTIVEQPETPELAPDPEAATPREPATPEPAEPAEPVTPEPIIDNAIEEYLSQFNIEGGLIEFEEGEKRHFNDLSEAEKFNVLNSLAEKQAAIIEQKYDLSPQEVEFLNASRTNNLSITDLIEQAATEKAQQLLAIQSISYEPIESLSPEAIYTKWLKENSPEASEEDLAEELGRAKESKFFEKTTESLRQEFLQKRENTIAQQQEQEYQTSMAEIEDERKQIVETVQNMNNISGWPIDDTEKNAVLEKVLEVNKFNDSVFMEEVFSTPENIFKAAWLFYKGDEKFDQLETHYKKEIAEAYKRGRREVSEGLPSAPIAGTNRGVANANNPDDPGARKAPVVSINDLHND